MATSDQLGVYYRTEDYVGVGRRFAIDFVDTFLVGLVCLALSFALVLVWPHEPSLSLAILTLWALAWFSYFVVLKRSRYRTLGYRLFGAQVVNLQGERPSLMSLTGRLLFVVGGPANFLIDLLWISSDPSRQAIRDKFAHTYVIRSQSTPAGSGKIVYRTYSMFGTTFYFREVKEASGRT